MACAAIPSYIRAAQCGRRYYDSLSSKKYGQIHPHLTNMGKYTVSIVTLIVGCAARENAMYYPFFLVMSFISTVYSYGWDVFMDWGLISIKGGWPTFLAHGKSMLHEDDTVPRHIVVFYIWCLASNMFLRLSWVWGLFVHFEDPSVKVWIFGALEIFRRAQWNLLRMEHEHMGNVDQYRAAREIPLPGEVQKPDHHPSGLKMPIQDHVCGTVPRNMRKPSHETCAQANKLKTPVWFVTDISPNSVLLIIHLKAR